jgi:hypothetical protein
LRRGALAEALALETSSSHIGVFEECCLKKLGVEEGALRKFY